MCVSLFDPEVAEMEEISLHESTSNFDSSLHVEIWLDIFSQLEQLTAKSDQDDSFEWQLFCLSLVSQYWSSLVRTVIFKRYSKLVTAYNFPKHDFILGHFTQLTYLYVYSTNYLTNHGLSKLTNLKTLSIDHNSLISDAGISRLTKLESLTLSFPTPRNYSTENIKRSAFVERMERKYGELIISDLSVQTLTNLRVLSVSQHYNRISDESLKRLTNLDTLRLTHIGFSHLKIGDAVINSLTGLRSLSLVKMRNLTNAALINLTNLTSLVIDSNDRISQISHLTGLLSLSLTSHNISDNEFQTLTKLHYLSMTGLSDLIINALSLETNTLDLSTSPNVHDFSLERLTNLTTLHVNNEITDHVISKLTHLQVLQLRGNEKVTNAGIRNLYHLTRLVINQNITPDGILKLTSLKELDLESETKFNYQSVLRLSNLKYVYYDLETEVEQQLFPSEKISHSHIKFLNENGYLLDFF